MAKLIKCKKCDNQIAKNAKTCPHCGARNNRGAGAAIFFTVICICLIISMMTTLEEEEKANKYKDTGVVAAGTGDAEDKFADQTKTVGDWEVTVTDFYFTDGIEAGLIGEYVPGEDSRYAVVDVKVKNLGEEAKVFLPYIAYGADVVAKIESGNYKYTRSELLGTADSISAEQLNPLSTASGIIPFDMPNEIIKSDAELLFTISADGDKASFKLR